MIVSCKFFASTIILGVISAIFLSYLLQTNQTTTMGDGKPANIYEFNVSDIDGNLVPLSTYQGMVCLIVNIASQWGFTNVNYEQLQQLHEKYSQQGLRILAFPCNQFGSQEPKADSEIKSFATDTKKSTFTLFSKIKVNGNEAIPLFNFLRNHKNATGFVTNSIKWNFTKFLIDRKGVPRKRFAPNVKPKDMEGDIEQLLSE